MAPRDIAKEVRPLIGLTNRQVEANQNYRQKVYERYREHGASERIANERADKAALKYAGKQHRYRAESIVLTENAFAYNRGAHMGVSQSIADGLMGRCEMVWTTAGTNRVCSRCLELKDRVVGHTDESGVTLPPLHPRCRCAIMYREVSMPRVMQPKPRKPLNDFDFDTQRFGTYEENKERFQHHDLPNGVVRVTRTELQATPYAVTETISKKGGITRNFYDESGYQYLQISNNNHGNIAESKYGKQGEHAHDYILTPDKKSVKSRISRELYDYERERNSDIL